MCDFKFVFRLVLVRDASVVSIKLKRRWSIHLIIFLFDHGSFIYFDLRDYKRRNDIGTLFGFSFNFNDVCGWGRGRRAGTCSDKI